MAEYAELGRKVRLRPHAAAIDVNARARPHPCAKPERDERGRYPEAGRSAEANRCLGRRGRGLLRAGE